MTAEAALTAGVLPGFAFAAWRERALDLRDRLLGSAGFRRLALRLPLARRIARRETRALFDLCAGFVYSQVLAACVRLELFALLRTGPLAADALAARLDLAEETARRLLDAAVSLRLLARREGDRYGLGPLGAVIAGEPGIAAMVRHHEALYRDLADPVALLRAGRGEAVAAYWPYAGAADPAALGADSVAAYSALMAASQPMVAAEVLAAVRFDRFRCLLDVGGGEGAFLEAVAARYPALGLKLFDLPAVAARARGRLAAAGLAVAVTGGDFRRDPLPEGADALSLVRVVHDHDDATVRTLLAAARRALPPGGTLILAEPMSGTRGAGPIGEAYFGLYLLAMGRGRPRTAARLAEMLTEAGFVAPRLVRTPTPLLVRVLVARSPGPPGTSVNHA
ncbi:methyltransferase domain-containing protein [Elioraea sp. Yellowstone]|uniref:methyltransferase n=1 Tax=Elioraea sp. Yellowstone TaxID=2592070 RepID=UPI00114F6F1A|nr:methyltransferase [Elioraea sp. Yellowstone]TQF81269.1 methyltransferase domain-containing protein [Elioraea sp. Yellowstone]